eukprot:tig00000900_g5365.t1
MAKNLAEALTWRSRRLGPTREAQRVLVSAEHRGLNNCVQVTAIPDDARDPFARRKSEDVNGLRDLYVILRFQELRTEVRASSWTRTGRKDPKLTFRVMDQDILQNDFPGCYEIPWERINTEFQAPGVRIQLNLG